MGYILPVHHNQYTQYANRLLPYHLDRLSLTKIQRVNLRTKQLYYENLSGHLNTKHQTKTLQHIDKQQFQKGVYLDVFV
jgi:hypothetical protein